MPRSRITLDNPVLASRWRTSYTRRSTYERRGLLRVRARTISDIMPPKPAKPVVPKVRPAAQTHAPRLTHSTVLKREAIRRRPRTYRHRRFTRSKLFTTMAVILFMFGLGVGFMGLRSNQQVENQARRLSTQAVAGDSTTDVPSEDKPSGTGSYQVAPDMPRILKIPKIGVEARVLRTTIKANNELGSPANIFDTAWYDGSSKPGQAGAMLIDGHVSGPTQNGVFYNLKKLQAGHKIQVERGDGKVFSYTVVSTTVYDADKVDMAAALVPVKPGRPGLSLITCTGSVDDSGDHFTQRLLVRASQD